MHSVDVAAGLDSVGGIIFAKKKDMPSERRSCPAQSPTTSCRGRARDGDARHPHRTVRQLASLGGLHTYTQVYTDVYIKYKFGDEETNIVYYWIRVCVYWRDRFFFVL